MVRTNPRQVLLISSLILTAMGTVLLVSEIYDWVVLPSMYNNEGIYSLITLFKYKENTYSVMFVWSLVVATGISFWFGKKINLLFYQAFLVSAFLILLIHLFASYLGLVLKIIVIAFVISLFAVLLKQLYKIQVVKEMKKSHKMWSLLSGLIYSIAYFLLYGYFG
jgi:hypothetical protein